MTKSDTSDIYKTKCDTCEIKKIVIDGLKMIAGGKRKIEEAVNKK